MLSGPVILRKRGTSAKLSSFPEGQILTLSHSSEDHTDIQGHHLQAYNHNVHANTGHSELLPRASGNNKATVFDHVGKRLWINTLWHSRKCVQQEDNTCGKINHTA